MTTNNTPAAFIHDGYTLDGFIAETPRLHPAMRFRYRPMVSQNIAVVNRELARTRTNEPRKAEAICARTVWSQVTEWDVLDHTGEGVTRTVDNILRIQPVLFAAIYQIVCGIRPSDEDPENIDAEADEDGERELDEALSGIDSAVESPEKNSAAA